jgi:methionyl-tRNA formyltransferase
VSRPLRIVFAGTPEFAVPSLEALHAAGHRIVAVYTQPDRPAGRGRALTPSPVKQRALALGLRVEQPGSLKSAAARAQLAAADADVMVVVAYGLLLGPKVLALPRHGCINLHASLLPRWRGAAPIQRALEAGDAETGVCVMRMDAALDAGPVYAREAVAIQPHDTAGTLHDRLSQLGAALLVRNLPAIAAGTLQPVAQAVTGVTWARKLTKDEAAVDWSQPAAVLDRRLRALTPWPVALTRWGAETLRLHAARPVANPAPGTAPGSVLMAGSDGIVVACGEGALCITRLQPAGGKVLEAQAFLAARDLSGARFT